MSTAAQVLYITYDGVLEALGESQVVAYLEGLAPAYAITLLSFEKPEDLGDADRAGRMRARLAGTGIRWIPLRYHKRPALLSTAFDLARSIVTGLRVSLARGVRVVHVRSYVPAVVALVLRRLVHVAFLFDMRGFWPDEKRESGQWSRRSVAYRLAKWFERRFFESADAIVSLTEAGMREFPGLGYTLRPGTVVEVIPTCTDLERFRPGPRDLALRSRLGLGDHVVVGCVGTMSNWYLREPMLDYLAFFLARVPGARALVVTAEDHARLRGEAAARAIDPARFIVTRADFVEMPAMIRLMDVGMFFIRPCFSKKGSAATKLGEFLGCGVPVVINDGVGDSGAIVRAARAGVVLAEPTPRAFEETLDAVQAMLGDADVATRCRAAATEHFDLERGVAKYAALYERLLAQRGIGVGRTIGGARALGTVNRR